MKNLMGQITFSPVEAQYEQLILGWFEKKHVSEWFHGVGLANSIEGLRRFIRKDSHWSSLWLAFYEQEPFAYLITSTIEPSEADDPDSPFCKWIEPDKKMSTLDLLIGEEGYLGKGLATRMIQTFINVQLADSELIFIDPEGSNLKAIHVYEKAGFEKIDEFIASWHPVPHVLMRLRKKIK